jgi:hypothetical protein
VKSRHIIPVLLLMLVTVAAAKFVGAAEDRADRKERRKSAETKKAEDRAAYDMLYQLHVPTFADLATRHIRADVEKELSGPKSWEKAEDFEIRKLLATGIADSVCRTIGDLQDAKVGWRIDRETKRTYLDLSVTASKNSGLDSQLAQMADLRTAFHGFQLDGSAFDAHWLGQADSSDAAAFAKVVEALCSKSLKEIENEGISDDEKAVRKELTSQIFDVLKRSAASGRSDGAVSLRLSDSGTTLVAGAYIADGPKLEGAVKTIGQFLQQHHPAFASLRFDVEKAESVNLHTMSIPAPDGDDHDKFVQMFGEQLDIVVGFGPEAIYLAAGRDAISALKTAIEKSKSPATVASPFEVTLAVKPVADFVAAVGRGNDQAQAKAISELLASTSGDAVARITTLIGKRSLTLRLEATEGIVQFIARIDPELKRLLLGE